MTTKKLPKNWDKLPFEKAFEPISLNKKEVKKKDYLTKGSFPIVDQGEDFIGGYSNDRNKVISIDKPLIAFGDHTRVFKYIDFDFIPGADGLKIYSPVCTTPKFSFYICQALTLPNKGYARHNAFLRKIIFPVPPLAEQKRIVEKIEKLFKQIDSSVASLQKTQEKISHFRDVMIRKQVFLKRKDFHYKQYSLGEALIYEQPTKYIVKSTKYDDSYKTPVLTPGKSFIKGYTNETFGIFEKDLPVIIFDDFTTASKFVTVPFKVKSSAMKILHINKEIADIKYIFYILSQIKDTKGTHKRYWISEYSTKIINLPSLPEQREIVAEIEKQFAAADKMQKAVDDALENAKKLKQAILKKAFNGELVPQDPKDEPPAALLAKIKAEREASKNNLKQSKRITK